VLMSLPSPCLNLAGALKSLQEHSCRRDGTQNTREIFSLSHTIQWIIPGKMQSSNNGLISRSSSTKLSMAKQHDTLASITDDMNIAQGLLTNPKVPRRSTSLTYFGSPERSIRLPTSSGALAEAYAEGRSRREVRSSNTWTSSSGDVLSDQDEVEDRSVFVEEYNRLARKVCRLIIIFEPTNSLLQHGVRSMVNEGYEAFQVSHTT